MATVEETVCNIAQEAAKRTSIAFEKLIKQSVRLEVETSLSLPVEDLTKKNISQDSCVAVHLPISGEVKGVALLIIPQDLGEELSALLTKKSAADSKMLDLSLFEELGSILFGNFFALFANRLHLSISQSIPQIMLCKKAAMLQEVVNKNPTMTKEVFLFELSFYVDRSKASQGAELFIFLSKEELLASISPLDAKGI